MAWADDIFVPEVIHSNDRQAVNVLDILGCHDFGIRSSDLPLGSAPQALRFECSDSETIARFIKSFPSAFIISIINPSAGVIDLSSCISKSLCLRRFAKCEIRLPARVHILEIDVALANGFPSGRISCELLTIRGAAIELESLSIGDLQLTAVHLICITIAFTWGCLCAIISCATHILTIDACTLLLADQDESIWVSPTTVTVADLDIDCIDDHSFHLLLKGIPLVQQLVMPTCTLSEAIISALIQLADLEFLDVRRCQILEIPTIAQHHRCKTICLSVDQSDYQEWLTMIFPNADFLSL
jgi:hypothetical protein